MWRNFLNVARSGGSIEPPSPGGSPRSRLSGVVMGWRENQILFFTVLGFCGMIAANNNRDGQIPFEWRALIVVLSGGALIYAAALIKWGG